MDWNSVIRALGDYLVAPQDAENRLRVALSDTIDSYPYKVRILGAPDFPIGLIVMPAQVRLIGDVSSIHRSPFLKELSNQKQLTFGVEQIIVGTTKLEILTTPLDDYLRQRLNVPSVTLINLFHPEMYPTPRLTLGIGYIASHLRDHFAGLVTLIDCQMPTSVEQLLQHITQEKPSILGLSVNFGQYDLLTELMDQIYAQFAKDDVPIIALGNILPSMSAETILDRYPHVIICQREGEVMMEQLARHHGSRSEWKMIPGAVFRDQRSGKTIKTSPQLLDLDSLSPPAFDTAKDILNLNGVITAEFSRGCHYNICSFCPRTHKASKWRGMTSEGFNRHLRAYSRLFVELKNEPYIFFADEEFIGRDEDAFGSNHNSRLDLFLRAVDENNFPIKFDAAMRADQAFMAANSDDWHYVRGERLARLSRSGLQRLFIGVESGSDGQLHRYNKGTDVQGNVSALRYLSMLGIKLRFGFITFDPLMSADELCENIDFLARRDVVLPTPETIDVYSIYNFVRNYHGKQTLDSGPYVFEEVSYMASPLEVLLRSQYLAESKLSHPNLTQDHVDVGFARIEVHYRDKRIEKICRICQRWINYSFPIIYVLKGLHKVSQGAIRNELDASIRNYRALTFHLLRTLTSSFGLATLELINKWEQQIPTPPALRDLIRQSHNEALEGIDSLAERILKRYVAQLNQVSQHFDSRTAEFSDLSKDTWRAVYEREKMREGNLTTSVRER